MPTPPTATSSDRIASPVAPAEPPPERGVFSAAFLTGLGAGALTGAGAATAFAGVTAGGGGGGGAALAGCAAATGAVEPVVSAALSDAGSGSLPVMSSPQRNQDD